MPNRGPRMTLAVPDMRWPKNTNPVRSLPICSGFSRFETPSNANRTAAVVRNAPRSRMRQGRYRASHLGGKNFRRRWTSAPSIFDLAGARYTSRGGGTGWEAAPLPGPRRRGRVLRARARQSRPAAAHRHALSNRPRHAVRVALRANLAGRGGLPDRRQLLLRLAGEAPRRTHRPHGRVRPALRHQHGVALRPRLP